MKALDQAVAKIAATTDHNELELVATEVDAAGFEGDDRHSLCKFIFEHGCSLNDDTDED